MAVMISISLAGRTATEVARA